MVPADCNEVEMEWLGKFVLRDQCESMKKMKFKFFSASSPGSVNPHSRQSELGQLYQERKMEAKARLMKALIKKIIVRKVK